MKTTFLLASLMAIAFIACEKDKNSEIKDNSGFRVKEIIYDFPGNDLDSKMVLTYEGEKLIQIFVYAKESSGNWFEYLKRDITYTGDHASEVYLSLVDGTWVSDYKIEYTLQSRLITYEEGSSLINNSWVIDFRSNYAYTADNLPKNWSYASDFSEDDIPSRLTYGEIVYINGKMREAFISNMKTAIPEYVSKDSCGYVNDSLKTYTHFVYNSGGWNPSSRSKFSYKLGKITHIDNYSWFENTWLLDYDDNFTYDKYGLLILDQNEICTISYQYEEGKGNAVLFLYYPDELRSGEPHLKSTGSQHMNKTIPYFERLNYWQFMNPNL